VSLRVRKRRRRATRSLLPLPADPSSLARVEARLKAERSRGGRSPRGDLHRSGRSSGEHRAAATNYYGGENGPGRWCVISARGSPVGVCVQDREYRRCRSLPSRQRPATCPSTLP